MATGGDSPLVLVTGASGFIGAHVVKLLLDDGYRVRGTVRSLQAEDKVKPLKDLSVGAKHELELVEADLLKEDSWKEAVKDCTYVIHVASPFPNKAPSKPDDVIKPAVDGTLAVLKAASESGTVKRVVLTSSIVAIYDGCIPIEKDTVEAKTFNEDVWVDVEHPLLDAYGRSKAMAERAAWDFIKQLPDDKKFELAVVNPGLVMGPVLTKHVPTSLEIIKRSLDKTAPLVPKLNLVVTDVRDVALAHIRAMTVPEAAGKRHIICTASKWMKDVTAILHKEFKGQGYFVPTIVAPNFFVWLNSLVEKSYRLIVQRLSREFYFENTRMTEVLKITPTELEKTIIDSAYSLIDNGILKKSRKYKKGKEAAAAGQQVNGEAVEEGAKAAEAEPAAEKKEEVQPQPEAVTA